MFLSSCCQWLFLAESSRWPEQNSGKLAWQTLYWRKVRTVEWSWPSVAFTRCHVAWCDDSDTLALMWSGSCTSVLPTCTWFGVEPAASAAGIVVARCEIALTPGERSALHCSEHAVASGCFRMECHGVQRCSSRALTVSDYRQASVRVESSADGECGLSDFSAFVAWICHKWNLGLF